MKKQNIIYTVIGVVVVLLAAGYLLSRYTEYRQLQLNEKKALNECIEKATEGLTSFRAANERQKCIDKFSR